MIVIISDLHLNDGTTCQSIDTGAFRRFVDELRLQAEAAGWRKISGKRKGEYVPVSQIDIILLGDILDLIRSDRWLYSDAYHCNDSRATSRPEESRRPWDAPAEYLPVLEEIVDRTLSHNEASLAMLRQLGEHGLEVIGSDEQHTRSTATVRLHYMVGNHDWFFHVDAPGFSELRQKVKTAFGLWNTAATPFPHQLTELTGDASALLDLCLAHRLWVQHGDLYDTQNYHAKLGRSSSSLGDAIVVELVNRYPDEVMRRLRAAFPEEKLQPQLIHALREIDNVRPSVHSPVFVRDIAERIAHPHQKQILIDTWKDCANRIFSLDFYKLVSRVQPGAALQLRLINLAQQLLPISFLRRIPALLGLFGDSYTNAAQKERYVIDGRCDFVVYGHTHQPLTRALRIRGDRHQLKAQVYFNSGTWRPLHQLVKEDSARFPYASSHVMTWVAFYRDDERFGRHYETWSGELDTAERYRR